MSDFDVDEVFGSIPKDEGIIILDRTTPFYYSDPNVSNQVTTLISKGKKFLGSARMRYGKNKLPCLLVSKGEGKNFEEGTYFIGDDPVPQLIQPMKLGAFTVYAVDFI